MGLLKELTYITNAIKLTNTAKKFSSKTEENFITQFEAIADKYKNNEAVVFEGNVLSYADLEERANKYAHWARQLNEGNGKAQTIALLMENRDEYLAAWIGILKSGNIAALINNNLIGSPLSHCINISKAKHIVLGAECAENYTNTADQLESKPKCWVQNGNMQGMENLDGMLETQPVTRLSKKLEHEQDALYIYTSGTTGNPKAAKISHRRLMVMAKMFSTVTKSKPKDRNYITLPLYHSAGGVCAVGTSLLAGGTIVLKRKFSIKDFWEDVYKHKVTQFQYIGELCRYLTNAPHHPLERKHNLRVLVGNGLRSEVWEEFQPRFKIPKIIEFYGATEGNVTLVNFDNTIGSVGRIPNWARKQSNIEVVNFDVEKEEPIRGDDGLCVRCKAGEVGEMLGEIFYDNPEMPSARFEGYVGSKETDKKILRDVFVKGDQWFRTGDLMKFDEKGYFYFIDRIGDTFRWKGENVATSEVAEVIAIFDNIDDVNVYGVEVSGNDGRAGMAAITNSGEIDLKRLYAHIEKNLPTYARPLFLRIQKKIEITGTFKHRKIDLVKEGFNPKKIEETLYFNHPESGEFVELEYELYQKITAKEIRL